MHTGFTDSFPRGHDTITHVRRARFLTLVGDFICVSLSLSLAGSPLVMVLGLAHPLAFPDEESPLVLLRLGLRARSSISHLSAFLRWREPCAPGPQCLLPSARRSPKLYQNIMPDPSKVQRLPWSSRHHLLSELGKPRLPASPSQSSVRSHAAWVMLSPSRCCSLCLHSVLH